MTPDPNPGAFGHAGRELGHARMAEMFNLMSKLQFMRDTIWLGVGAAWKAGYSDEALACLRSDAQDLVDASGELQAFVDELCDHWQAQRQEHS